MNVSFAMEVSFVPFVRFVPFVLKDLDRDYDPGTGVNRTRNENVCPSSAPAV